MRASLRPVGADDLGLRRALADRMLPLLVGAMVFLAGLTLAGAVAAESLAEHWRLGAASMVTVSVPMPDAPAARPGHGPANGPAGSPVGGPGGGPGGGPFGGPGGGPGHRPGQDYVPGADRADAAASVLASAPAILSARRLAPGEIALLLKPWLGADAAGLGLHLPAMFEVRVGAAGPDANLAARLQAVAPGSLIQRNGQWLTRLGELVRSLQACAALALLIVTLMAASMVGLATRAGLAARRDAIEIVHGLGASDGMIAGQFARRIGLLVVLGAILGVIVVIPLLLALARLAAPFIPGPAQDGPLAWARLPPLLWGMLAALPVAAGLIGWVTAQASVHGWLRRLP